jgi:hypothetical protein
MAQIGFVSVGAAQSVGPPTLEMRWGSRDHVAITRNRRASALMLCGAVALLAAAALATGDGTSASDTPREMALGMSFLVLAVTAQLPSEIRHF